MCSYVRKISNMNSIALVVILLSSQLVLFVESDSRNWNVKLYEDKSFDGRWCEIEGTGTSCVNLEHESLCDWGWFGWTNCINAVNQVSSVNTDDTCIRVYSEPNCEFRKHQIEPGTGCHSNWDDSDCGFNDNIKSISGCSYDDCTFPNMQHLVRRTGGQCEIEHTRDGAEVRISYKQIGAIQVPEILETHFVLIRNHPYAGFGSRFDDRMEELDALTNDAKGHMVASSLGGTAERWNLVPQTTKINNGDGTGQGWKSIERQIKSYVQEHRCHNVFWQLVIGYGDNDRPHRPLTFQVSTDFYNGRDLEYSLQVDCHNTRTNNVCTTYGTRGK